MSELGPETGGVFTHPIKRADRLVELAELATLLSAIAELSLAPPELVVAAREGKG